MENARENNTTIRGPEISQFYVKATWRTILNSFKFKSVFVIVLY